MIKLLILDVEDVLGEETFGGEYISRAVNPQHGISVSMRPQRDFFCPFQLKTVKIAIYEPGPNSTPNLPAPLISDLLPKL